MFENIQDPDQTATEKATTIMHTIRQSTELQKQAENLAMAVGAKLSGYMADHLNPDDIPEFTKEIMDIGNKALSEPPVIDQVYVVLAMLKAHNMENSAKAAKKTAQPAATPATGTTPPTPQGGATAQATQQPE